MRSALLLLLIAGCASARLDYGSRSTLDAIRSSGVIKLGYRESAIPFSYITTEGKPGGYSVDLCTAVVDGIAAELSLGELRIEWVKTTAENRFDVLLDGTIDLECGSTSPNYARQEKVDFSLFIYLDGATFMSRVESHIQRLGDLSGKKIAILNGTSTEQVLEAALKKDGIEAEIMKVSTNKEGLRNVSDRKADAFVSDRTILLTLAASSAEPEGYRVVEHLLSYEPYALMLRRDSTFRIAVNRQLSRLYRSDAINAIYGKWFGAFGPPSDELKTTYRIFGSVQ